MTSPREFKTGTTVTIRGYEYYLDRKLYERFIGSDDGQEYHGIWTATCTYLTTSKKEIVILKVVQVLAYDVDDRDDTLAELFEDGVAGFTDRELSAFKEMSETTSWTTSTCKPRLVKTLQKKSDDSRSNRFDGSLSPYPKAPHSTVSNHLTRSRLILKTALSTTRVRARLRQRTMSPGASRLHFKRYRRRGVTTGVLTSG